MLLLLLLLHKEEREPTYWSMKNAGFCGISGILNGVRRHHKHSSRQQHVI